MLSADIIIFLNAKQSVYAIIINSEEQRAIIFRKLISQQAVFMLKKQWKQPQHIIKFVHYAIK